VGRHLAANEWILDRASSSVRVVDPRPITIRFDPGGVVSGVTPCNSYRGSYTLSGGATIRISGISQTLRACDARAQAAEQEYLAVLQTMDSVEPAISTRLTLAGPSNARLAYHAFDVASAILGNWEVVNVARDDAIRGITPGLHPVVTFRADATMAVESACGRRAGSWSLAGDRLTISGLATADTSCAPSTPAAVDDAAIASALVGADTVDITPGMLTVLSHDGLILLVAIR
jgi:heat shock protein HslJ